MRLAWVSLLASCNGILGQHPGILDEEAGIDASTKAPDAIFGPRLCLWLDASVHESIVHDAMANISGWKDRSGKGNHAQTRTAGKGVLGVSTDAAGREAIHFAGDAMSTAVLEIVDADSLRWGSGDWAIGVVASWLNPPGSDEYTALGFLWHKTETAWPNQGVTITANMTTAFQSDGTALGSGDWVFAGVRAFGSGWNAGVRTADTGYAEGRFHVIVARRTGTIVELRVDGKITTNATPATNVDAIGTSVQIGGYLDNNVVHGPLQGNVAEVIAASGTIGDADANALESYLRGKYRL